MKEGANLEAERTVMCKKGKKGQNENSVILEKKRSTQRKSKNRKRSTKSSPVKHKGTQIESASNWGHRGTFHALLRCQSCDVRLIAVFLRTSPIWSEVS